jgi:hypothetical protein
MCVLLNIVKDINIVLRKHNITSTISPEDISIADNSVSDGFKCDSKLSNIVINFYWPAIKDKIVYHYTSKNAGESILKFNKFRLYTILKRFNDEEIKTFCVNHSLAHPLSLNIKNGEPNYKNDIMPNIYYSSFTDINVDSKQESYFWRTFAHSDGYRFKFHVRAKNPDFRKITYEVIQNKSLPLLNDLSCLIKSKYNRIFILSGISRICAFYLSKSYKIENEYRILYKFFENFSPTPNNDGNYNYYELSFGTMEKQLGYEINLLEVQTDNAPKAIPVAKDKIVKRTPS